MVLYAALNNVSVKSRRVLGKLPELLVHLFGHHRVNRDSKPTILSAKERKPLLPSLNYLVEPGQGSKSRPPAPEADAPPLQHRDGNIMECLTKAAFKI